MNDIKRFNGIEENPKGVYVYYDDYMRVCIELSVVRKSLQAIRAVSIADGSPLEIVEYINILRTELAKERSVLRAAAIKVAAMRQGCVCAALVHNKPELCDGCAINEENIQREIKDFHEGATALAKAQEAKSDE